VVSPRNLFPKNKDKINQSVSEEQENAGTKDDTVSAQASADAVVASETAPSEQSTPTTGGVTGRSAQPDARPVGIDLQDPRLRMKGRRQAGAKGSKTKWKRRDRECAVRYPKM